MLLNICEQPEMLFVGSLLRIQVPEAAVVNAACRP